jgi:hypothetical protein
VREFAGHADIRVAPHGTVMRMVGA